ncbi:MAG TPA: YegP family protein [Spirochaetota bacterium]|nr:YegP family protein [Spirochaetota bacterium]HOM09756.1 YegP family protein [Spirochaetota bacterium]HPP49344.1 YegP family protein [Spirochaetota bacterium]
MYHDKKGEYRFRLKAANGETIGQGEGYSKRSGCMRGIESIKKNAANAKVVEI